MFADLDHIRNSFGRHFVQGYHYWRGETDLDEWTLEVFTRITSHFSGKKAGPGVQRKLQWLRGNQFRNRVM